ncbi:Sulfoxide reductase catalytic subunit YedY precursor [Hartmannibacter diazotrophicus]|uniref:Sulfoxide reductase catalytic subunit YedY n=1 Tax=Hartmannibacter diazotrophicus TaxID=1482074 RepID=A0A2C9D7V3_9HYPH|nr:sulfite oxidase-like oxidoreductase [Hartmannibacter diazotrophicus]SON56356.1 Sulfoxide reductase catalytic subunit YedY precursor [Hartmannibacter diazotrophicus]
MPDDSHNSELPPETKLTRSKLRWAKEQKFLTGREMVPGAERLPPGQHLTRDWPVLDLGIQPDVPLSTWRLQILGKVAEPLDLSWDDFQALPQSTFLSDIHCVTTWSRYDNTWEGVSTRDLLMRCDPAESATHVMLHSYDGYTTNLALEDFAAPNALIATHWQGQPIAREHGGPARLVVPHLYFWKSAKWLRAIEFLEADKRGFWEVNGYHNHADPWAEERYSED